MDIILYLLIGLLFMSIDDKYFAKGSSEVHINGNITAEVNSNDIKLKCSFTLGEGDAFYSTALTTENATTDEFIEIAGYLKNTKPLFTPFGMDLFENKTTLIHFDENQNMLKFAFNNVTCRHERRYKCLLFVTSSSSVLPRLFESDAIWISVTDLHIAAISGGVAFFMVVLFVIVVCICKKRLAESKNLTKSKDSNVMLNCNPKHPDQSKSSGYESVGMDGETPVLLSKSNGNEHAVTDFVKQHNENYLQNQKEEDEKVKKSPGSHQHVEYAQVDETKKLKNKNKQNDTDQETEEKNGETKFESEEMHAKKDKNVDRFDEPMITNNEHSDQETESSVTTSDPIMGRVNPAFENDDVSSKDETIKVAMVSPIIRMAEPHIEHKQNGPTNVESKDRVNLSQTVDDDDDYCNAIRNSTSSASPADTKQKENRNADTPQGIHERSDRRVDNAQYFDTSSHLESVASSEDTKQKENKNAEARLGINECSGRTVDNAEYFDITTHFEKQHNHNDPETAIKNDQSKSYTNQAFDGEDNQEKDAISSPVQLLDRLQVDEQNNQNNDKQSKHDYENVGSTAQPESSNGETI